jgi:D-mannonate dehydratase
LATRSESYLLLVEFIQSLEDVLDFVDANSTEWELDVERFRRKITEVEDEMVTMAARHGWKYAFLNSRMSALFEEYDEFSRQHWRDHFEGSPFND